ncbi:hypothetical protein [Ulvibacterium sp.]|uniref:hypothetical protein n=1 Tax=Ulvibacterium sp. TaxID=2665914 RepID=UPI00262CE106|nr:hypothetical protein [Ulvibacterium sp.]
MKNLSRLCVFLVIQCLWSQDQVLTVLDANKDGVLDPYEALDVLLTIQKKSNGELTFSSLVELAQRKKQADEQEVLEMFEGFEQDNNGNVILSKLTGEMTSFAKMMDDNEDGLLSMAEAFAFDMEDALLADEEEIQERTEGILKEYKAVNDAFKLERVPKRKRGRFMEYDKNKDAVITKEELLNFFMADNIPVKFKVNGKTAYMTGVITTALPATVLRLLNEHPEVDTIEMLTVPGSIDDEANIRAAFYVNKAGLTTKLNAKSTVASGGTDFFMAGKKRIVEEGAYLGVHSWGGGPVPATEVPKDDPVHVKYLEFYEAVGVPTSFYWYTLEVAPAEGMHKMTAEEIEKYKVRKSE